MNNWNPSNEGAIRVTVFLSVFGMMAILEVLAARRTLSSEKRRRWICNLGLVLLDTAVVRILFPAGAVEMALKAGESNWGFFNKLNLPYGLAVILSIVVLDFVIYLQHVMFHAVPVLWRFHRVHHADTDFDVTTGIRFHPIEIVLSMFIKLSVVASIGPPALSVLFFEVLLNALAMFNHANVRIPLRLDGFLRWVIVTPDMHRVHHSINNAEYMTNFGFNLSWWDRLLGTYLAQPAEGHEGMTIGLPNFREANWQTLPRLLLIPFNRNKSRESNRF